ncbi:MAG: glutathione S-transferase family protein [Pseudomonadota bacterium]
MRLLSSPSSPYVRKARLAAHIKGLINTIEIVPTDTRAAENPALAAANPLSKIPALVLDDGTTIFDSAVICEYLDAQVAHPVLFPGEGAARWRALTLGALADGVLDAALLLVYEKRFRPEEKWHLDWMARQQAKVDQALRHLEQAPPEWTNHPDYGHLTVACALGYLDLRQGGAWRTDHPNLVGWLNRYADAVPAFAETAPME